MPVQTYLCKDLLIDSVRGLPISINEKSETYDLILMILDKLTKMIHYEPVKFLINALGLVDMITHVLIGHHGLSD